MRIIKEESLFQSFEENTAIISRGKRNVKMDTRIFWVREKMVRPSGGERRDAFTKSKAEKW
jgi:hypothetical protein